MPRGRKPKIELEKPPPKKRGRKPKGGKIITDIKKKNENNVKVIENIILHLKCKKSDLKNIHINKINSYDFNNNENIFMLNKKNNIIKQDTNENNISSNKKELWIKLRKLAFYLNTNDVSDKRSACFWCTYDFDNPPIYIPKFELNGSYQCYGCFCSPECSTSFLFNEQIDSSVKFERYALLNYLYCKIYNYEKNIKPAPNPYYTLSKYQGNLSINEYRSLFNTERFIIVVDKPLTRSLPELHEDNDEFVMNTSNNSSVGHFKLRRNKKKPSKAEVLAENFGMK